MFECYEGEEKKDCFHNLHVCAFVQLCHLCSLCVFSTCACVKLVKSLFTLPHASNPSPSPPSLPNMRNSLSFLRRRVLSPLGLYRLYLEGSYL